MFIIRFIRKIISQLKMNLEYTFIAIMFPAIPLTMVMFGNRFHTTSVLIRQMHDKYIYEKVVPKEFNPANITALFS